MDKLVFPQLKTEENPESMLKLFDEQLLGAKVASVGRHGKYFWLRLVKAHRDPTVMLMHFGMTGMVKLRNVDSHLIFMENGGDKKVMKEVQRVEQEKLTMKDNVEQLKEVNEVVKVELEGDELKETVVKIEKTPGGSRSLTEAKTDEESESTEWPPRFTKFEIVFENSDAHPQILDFAFTDPRRLGRVRFLTGPQYLTDEQLLLEDPLKSLGPDYSKDPEKALDINKEKVFVSGDPDPDHHGRPRLSLDEFCLLVLSRKKPIKSLLLDQDQFAGIGNWVSDEILYQARIHPGEMISSKISDPSSEHLRRLYDAIIYVMEESVRVEGNVREFPDDWLMLFRWGKGRKEKPKTKQGYSVEYETIGGRTSCFVPELQKPLKRERNDDDIKNLKSKRKVKRNTAKESQKQE